MKNKKMIGTSLIIIMLTLISFSIVMIASVSHPIGQKNYNNPAFFLIRQGIWVFIGLIIFFIISKIDYKKYKKYSSFIYLGSTILLIAVLIIGKEVKGAKRWLGFGNFSIQPSEIAKTALIISLAGIIDNYRKSKTKKESSVFWNMFMLISGYAILILLEKSFSSTLQIVILGFSMIFISGIKLRKILYLIPIILMGGVATILTMPYRVERIKSFLGKGTEDTDRQVNQALIAVGKGGFFGETYGKGLQRNFWLPEIHTDYIFAAVGEETGFIGSVVLVLLYIGLLIVILATIKNCKNYYGKYILVGIFTMFAVQITGNMLVVLGRIPSTGITLPLFSYGGSSIINVMIALGIVYNVIKSIYAEEENE